MMADICGGRSGGPRGGKLQSGVPVMMLELSFQGWGGRLTGVPGLCTPPTEKETLPLLPLNLGWANLLDQ